MKFVNIILIAICILIIALFSQYPFRENFVETKVSEKLCQCADSKCNCPKPFRSYRYLVKNADGKVSKTYLNVVKPNCNFTLSVLIKGDNLPDKCLRNLFYFTHTTNANELANPLFKSPSVWIRNRQLIFGVGYRQQDLCDICTVDMAGLRKGLSHLVLIVRDNKAEFYLNGHHLHTCINQNRIVVAPHLVLGPVDRDGDIVGKGFNGSISIAYSDLALDKRLVSSLYQFLIKRLRRQQSGVPILNLINSCNPKPKSPVRTTCPSEQREQEEENEIRDKVKAIFQEDLPNKCAKERKPVKPKPSCNHLRKKAQTVEQLPDFLKPLFKKKKCEKKLNLNPKSFLKFLLSSEQKKKANATQAGKSAAKASTKAAAAVGKGTRTRSTGPAAITFPGRIVLGRDKRVSLGNELEEVGESQFDAQAEDVLSPEEVQAKTKSKVIKNRNPLRLRVINDINLSNENLNNRGPKVEILTKDEGENRYITKSLDNASEEVDTYMAEEIEEAESDEEDIVYGNPLGINQDKEFSDSYYRRK